MSHVVISNGITTRTVTENSYSLSKKYFDKEGYKKVDPIKAGFEKVEEEKVQKLKNKNYDL